MKYILTILLSLLIPVCLFAQHGAIHHEIRNTIHHDIKEEQERKGEKPVEESFDRFDKLDSTNRAKIKPFPTLHLRARTEFPEKPSYNCTNDSYLKGYEMVSIKRYDDPKMNKYEDDRTIMNYKTGKAIIVRKDEKGNKTAVEMNLKTIGGAISSAAKKSNNTYENGLNNIKATSEYKVISGWKCRKYTKEGVTGLTELWLAKDLFADDPAFAGALSKAFSGLEATMDNTVHQNNEGMNGFPVQTIYTPKTKTGQQCIITYEKIEKDVTQAEFFSTAGYDVKPMPTIRELWNSRD